MKNNLILSYLILLLLVLAVTPAIAEQQSLGTFIQNIPIQLIQTCDNCTSVNITSIVYPDGSINNTNLVMTRTGTFYNYTVRNTSQIGKYIYNTVGNLNGVTTTQPVEFYISYTGKDTSIVFIVFYIICLLILIVFIFGCVYSFVKFENFINRLAMIGFVYLLLIAISFILYQICLDFIGASFFITKFIQIIFIVLMYGTIIIFPIGFMYYMYSIYKIKEIENLINKGISEDEAIHRYKSRRKYG